MIKMNRQHIASELLQAAKEVVAGRRDMVAAPKLMLQEVEDENGDLFQEIDDYLYKNPSLKKIKALIVKRTLEAFKKVEPKFVYDAKEEIYSAKGEASVNMPTGVALEYKLTIDVDEFRKYATDDLVRRFRQLDKRGVYDWFKRSKKEFIDSYDIEDLLEKYKKTFERLARDLHDTDYLFDGEEEGISYDPEEYSSVDYSIDVKGPEFYEVTAEEVGDKFKITVIIYYTVDGITVESESDFSSFEDDWHDIGA
jgi:hypothetical protein